MAWRWTTDDHDIWQHKSSLGHCELKLPTIFVVLNAIPLYFLASVKVYEIVIWVRWSEFIIS